MSTSRWQGEAPGRLDFLGGVADYSGSLVLQTPIRARTRVTITPLVEPRLELVSEQEGEVTLPLPPRTLTAPDGEVVSLRAGSTSTRPRAGRATRSVASCCSARPRTGGRRPG